MRYFVHDFIFEKTNIENETNCFFYHVGIYCSHDKECIDENLEKFLVGVGNSTGIGQHLKVLQGVFNESKHKSFFNGPFMVLDNYDEDAIMQLLKEKIEGVTGINKRELLYNLSPYFEWEYLSDPNVVREFFK
jgi:hypothetical protein